MALAIGLALAAPAVAAEPAQLASQAARTNPWGIALTDVIPDPSVRYGVLPNGMKYAILANATPKGTASVRLHFGFGSIGEGDTERGLAHFIEHMAFNGTTHVPEGEMIKILERQGLAFGPDTNAQTGFDSTTYMLDLPKTDAERVDTALFLLREVAGEVRFDAAAVNSERGVILGEKRARDNFQLRQITDILGFQLPGTPYPNRLPIGTEAVLTTAPAARLHNLYRRYYRPENATLVFVGDADPAIIEAKIRKVFGDWKGAGAAGAPLPRGTVEFARPAAFDSFIDPAVATTVDLSVARPWTNDLDTAAQRRTKMIDGIASAMFNRRLQRLVNAPGSALLGAAMYDQEQKDAARITTVKVAAKDQSWQQALASAEQEVRRALEHGFAAAEIKTQLADTSVELRTAAEQANTRTNQGLANSILSVVGEPRFVTTPRYRLELFEAMAGTITPAQIDTAYRKLWSGSAPLVHLSAKQDVPAAQLASAFAASRAVALAAPKAAAAQAFAYDSFGKTGTIAADSRIADLGLRTVRFANNVRLNIKKSDFEAGKVRFLVRLGDGLLDLPLDKPGLAPMISILSSIGAVKKHSLEELKELTAGKVVTLGAGVSDDAFVATGTTTPADLAFQMKVSAAYLLDPGFRPEAASQWANAIPVFAKQLKAQPQSVAQTRLPVMLANGDERFGLPGLEILAKRNFDEARAALAPVIASAPIEVTIVGDVDEQAAIAAVANSLGAVPARKLADKPNPAALKAAFRTARTPIVLTHEGAADQALVQAAWPTDDDRDYRTVVGVDLLKDVLDLMLTASVREKLGDSYGVSLASSMSNVFPKFGYLSATAVVAPDKADEVHKAFEEAAAELRTTPVTADLLARARNPELQAVDRAMRENGFWLGALSQAQSEPERLDRIRKHKAVLEAVTPADLQKLALLYLQPARLQRSRIVSTKLPATAVR
ncbi:MAG: insulinase family protein [Sphingomicrobium sp.]